MLRLHQHKKCNVIGITTVCGNSTADNSFQTANVIIKDLFGIRNIPIYNSPQSSQFDHKCSFWFGKDGHYGNINKIATETYSIHQETADEFLIRKLNEERDLTIIAIAPLTNLFICEQQYQGILQNAKEIIIMGGAINVKGNVDDRTEYNFWCNPEAVQTVLKYPNIVLFPLDVTNEITFSMSNLLRQLNGHKYEGFYQNILFEMCKQSHDTHNVVILDDIATALYYEDPNLFEIKRQKIVVNERGDICIDSNGYEISVAWKCKDYHKANEMMLKIFDLE
eukprot:556359_1